MISYKRILRNFSNMDRKSIENIAPANVKFEIIKFLLIDRFAVYADMNKVA